MESNLLIRKVKDDDIEEVFKLSNEDYVRRFSINKEKIRWEDHVVWFNDIIHNHQNVFYVVTDESDKFLGQIRYKITGIIATVSISLSGLITGKGYSKMLLLKSIEKLFNEKKEINEVVAYVSEENIASIKLFEGSGFCFSGKQDSFVKYIYSRKGVPI